MRAAVVLPAVPAVMVFGSESAAAAAVADAGRAGPSLAGKFLGFVLVLVVVVGLVVLTKTLLRMAEDDRPDTATDAHARSGSPRSTPVGARAATPPPAVLVGPADGTLPPIELRPGQLATLREGGVPPIAVAATLLDLAVRGFLRIEELPAVRRRRQPRAWLLTAVHPRPKGPLLVYERILLTAAFEDRDSVTIEELRRTSARRLDTVRSCLLRDAVERGWFPEHPGTAGAGAPARSMVMVLVWGFAAASLMMGFRELFFVGIAALLLAGLVPRAVGRHSARRRTRAGDAALARAGRFTDSLATVDFSGSTVDCAFEIFSRSLPYAMVLGFAREWSQRFRGVIGPATVAGSTGWFCGLGGGAALMDLCDGITSFCDTASSTMDSSSGWSGSGGFDGSGGYDSGGGGGGGGGGGDSGGSSG